MIFWYIYICQAPREVLKPEPQQMLMHRKRKVKNLLWYCHFRISVLSIFQTLETLNNGEELVFLYQLTEGHTSSSFACHIAAQVGLPQEVVQRGIQVSWFLFYKSSKSISFSVNLLTVLGRLRHPKWLTSTKWIFDSNWQLSFLNQWQGVKGTEVNC